MKIAATLIAAVLENRAWCTRCNRFVSEPEILYSYGTPYHKACGTDVHSSDLLDEDEKMLRRALEELTG